jgi:hypothetical protein
MQLWLEDRYEKYENFTKEANEKGELIHKRTLKAYNSIKNNMKYLYVYEDLQ